jgi:hypothetical protein
VWLDWGLYGWWWVLTAWLSALSLVYLARFLGGKWRSMRVIEAEYLKQEFALEAPSGDPSVPTTKAIVVDQSSSS